MRGWEGLFPSACAASWARILLGRVWMELVSVCLRLSERGLVGARFGRIVSVCQRGALNADFAGRDWGGLIPYACASASVVLSGRGLEGLFPYACAEH